MHCIFGGEGEVDELLLFLQIWTISTGDGPAFMDPKSYTKFSMDSLLVFFLLLLWCFFRLRKRQATEMSFLL